MKQYNVTGMSCAACSARVEKAVSSLDGVTSCSVSLLTNAMSVEGAVSAEKVIAAVEEAGYGCSEKGSKTAAASNESDALVDRETPVLKRRLLTSIGFLLVLMYFSMGHHMLGWPVPPILANPISIGLVQMLLAIVCMIINKKFFVSGSKGLLHKAPNMHTLVAMGPASAFISSTVPLF
ncbi:MAG: cation transporter, partial [Clostridia bacterium]|nr:cation transporter [Clostridia bacterium]